MLLQYVDEHKLILMGNTVASGNAERKRLWRVVADMLNAMTGPKKPVDAWKIVLNNQKMAHKAKARNLRHERNLTGSGELNEQLQEYARELTFNEQCLERIMGYTVDGHAEVSEAGFSSCNLVTPRPTVPHESVTSQHLGSMRSPTQTVAHTASSEHLHQVDTLQHSGSTSSLAQAQPHSPPSNPSPHVEPGTSHQQEHTASRMTQLIERSQQAAEQDCEALEAIVEADRNLTTEVENLAQFFND